MRCPTLSELPPPPTGRTGWPWIVESPQLSDAMSDGRPWPRISIVTPSYNQGQFIEETIRSILLQGYPNLEYVVVDGGSRDQSLEIIKKYQKWFSGWISERDSGQPNAINKGFKFASGEIWQWINSDDVLLPGALGKIGLSYTADALLTGNVIYFGEGFEEVTEKNTALSAESVITGYRGVVLQQAGIWFSGEKFKELGGLNESFQYLFDWHFFIKYLDRWPQINNLDQDLAKFRLHSESKTVSRSQCFGAEKVDVLRRLLHESIGRDAMGLCIKGVATLDWWKYLDNLRKERNGRALPIAKILVGALTRPKTRFNRFTAGVIKAILTD
jgi:glycosyltransferase involved in cell wall biosynthesis